MLEMVIAIAIFAVIGAISYATLDRFLVTRAIVEERNATTTRLQRAISHFERDVRFMTRRTIRDELGEIRPAMQTDSSDVIGADGLIEVTVAQPSFRDTRWHRLRRVGWALAEGRLIRQVWPVLDREFDSAPRETMLLDGVASVSLRFYTRDPSGRSVTAKSEWEDVAGLLPLAVELILTLDDGTTYRRLVEVAYVSNP